MNGLFNLGIFENAKDDDILNMQLNESVENMGPSVPGGLTEKPTAKPEGGEFGPSIPAGSTITKEAYNSAIADLQKSFKESYELLGVIAKRRGMLISGGEPNTERAAIMLLDEFRAAKLGKISLESPKEL